MDHTFGIDRFDVAMRNWSGAEPDPVCIGSDAHKRLFCRMLLETHNPYKPAVIAWPQLSQDALQRLTSLPIWDIAVQTEGRAAVRVHSFAQRVADPLLRRALEMNAGEEARHKLVLNRLVESYGVHLAPEPAYLPPRDPEWAWLVTGYSECVDTFFAFGLFELARRSGYFPPELVDTFEPVIQEEGRHILFFVNWAAWYRLNLPWWRRPKFFLKTCAVWLFLIWERIGIARSVDADRGAQDANFAMTGSGSVGVELTPRELIDLCLAENERRMAGYDRRLLRPLTVPWLAHRLRRLVPAS
ncbi:MAG TPA: ferritin-like domain-containing protein [Burkholderiaceae bacterium]|jgi:hypothetical protein|nr:ferritin-like domain-containing protein [Burkholderiaceae bacterium]